MRLEQTEPGRWGRAVLQGGQAMWPTGKILAFTLNEMSHHWRVLSRGAPGADLRLHRLLWLLCQKYTEAGP